MELDWLSLIERVGLPAAVAVFALRDLRGMIRELIAEVQATRRTSEITLAAVERLAAREEAAPSGGR